MLVICCSCITATNNQQAVVILEVLDPGERPMRLVDEKEVFDNCRTKVRYQIVRFEERNEGFPDKVSPPPACWPEDLEKGLYRMRIEVNGPAKRPFHVLSAEKIGT